MIIEFDRFNFIKMAVIANLMTISTTGVDVPPND